MMIRPEQPSDFAEIREVIASSFGRAGEARLVEELRELPEFDPALALVAEVDGRVVGQILFSPVTIESATCRRCALALAPLCVHADYRNRGIGSGLVLRGLQECKARGHGVVVVVGEPGYYVRFGFQRASEHGVRAPFDVPDEAYMVIELRPDALAGARGTVRYSQPFEDI